MHNMVWKGEEGGDSDDEYSRSTSRMGDDDDDYSSGDSDGDSEVWIVIICVICGGEFVAALVTMVCGEMKKFYLLQEIYV